MATTFLENATTKDERWKVYEETPDGSDVERATVRALCSN